MDETTERTAWRCEKCGNEGEFTIDADAGVYEGVEVLRASHRTGIGPSLRVGPRVGSHLARGGVPVTPLRRAACFHSFDAEGCASCFERNHRRAIRFGVMQRTERLPDRVRIQARDAVRRALAKTEESDHA